MSSSDNGGVKGLVDLDLLRLLEEVEECSVVGAPMVDRLARALEVL